MLNPIPSQFGLETICCAYRSGVIDISGDKPEPSVYILGRNTDNGTITKFVPILFASRMPKINATLKHNSNSVDVDASHLDGTKIFSANLRHTEKLDSELFATIDEFDRFIKNGVSSYAPSINEDNLVRIDLHKDDHRYEPLDATITHNVLEHMWPDTKLVFDSAVKASDGMYRWTRIGVRSKI